MENKLNILGICGRITPSPSANTICLINVFEELVRDGYQCHILASGIENSEHNHNGVHYHVIKLNNSNYSLRKRLSNLIHITRLPQTEPDVTRVKYKRLKELQDEFHFDFAIGVCASYANIYAALQLKEACPNVRVIGYYLDSIESLSRLSGVTRKIRDHFSYKGEEAVFQELDGIVLPVASCKIYNGSRYKNVQDKIVYAEFPTFVPKASNPREIREEIAEIRAMIVGTLNDTFRDPRLLFESIRSVCDANKLKIHIDVYGPNDEKLFAPFSGSEYVSYMLKGRVPHQVIEEALTETDLLINISNSGMLAVPSKIFEYFSAYKPILTQVTDEDDSAMSYYERYDGSCVFYAFKERKEQEKYLIEFLRSVKHRTIDIERVNEAFNHNTPAYVSEQIKSIIEKND